MITFLHFLPTNSSTKFKDFSRTLHCFSTGIVKLARTLVNSYKVIFESKNANISNMLVT